MRRRLPPLNSLRAFEAAARHLSFTRAAEELHVTSGAVSRHVKMLEDYLKVSLFKRANQSLVISEEGQAYMVALGKALDIVDAATSRLRTNSEEGFLTVRLLPTLAMGWLIPRLHDFYETYPQIEIRLTTSTRPDDDALSDVDVLIGRKMHHRHGYRHDVVIAEHLIVVCSPILLAGKDPMKQPADLSRLTLLHSSSRPEAWPMWLNAVGANSVDPEMGLRFEHYIFAIQAAIGGLGALVVPRILVEDYLASQQLVAPFDIAVPSEEHYYLIYPEHRADSPRLQAFRKWILAMTGHIDPASPKRSSEHSFRG